MKLKDININDVLIDNLSVLLAAPYLHNKDYENPADAFISSFFLEALILHERLIIDMLQPSAESITLWAGKNKSQNAETGNVILQKTVDHAKAIDAALQLVPHGIVEPLEIPQTDKESILEATLAVFPETDFNWEWYAKIFEDDRFFFQYSKAFREHMVNELTRIMAVMNFGQEIDNLPPNKYAEAQYYFRVTGSIKKQAYYLGLSRFLGIPYLANSFRNKVYKAMMVAINNETIAKETLASESKASPFLVEEAVIEEFERNVIRPIDETLQGTLPWQCFRIPLPPLTRIIIERAKSLNVSLLNAAMEIRNSKNAIAFRKWCHEILSAYEENNRKELMRLLKALYQESSYWGQKLGSTDGRSTIGISLFGLNFDQETVNPLDEIQAKFRKHILFLRDMV